MMIESSSRAVSRAPITVDEYGQEVQTFPAFEQIHLLTFIQLADAKASVFLAITSGAIAYLVGHYGLTWLKLVNFGRHLVLLSLTTAVLATSAGYALAVIIPRLGKRPHGIIDFRAVSQHRSADQYVNDVMEKSRSELFQEQASYCYDLARTCARKYRLLKYSLITGILGYAMFLSVLVLP